MNVATSRPASAFAGDREMPRKQFQFGPLERRGLIAGWRGGQIACVAVGMVFGVGVLREMPTVAGVLAAGGCVLVSVFAACWPIGGRTAEEWGPVVARWALERTSGGGEKVSRAPSAGLVRAVTASGVLAGERPPAPPGALARFRILAVPVPSSTSLMGAVMDTRSQMYTAVLAVEGQALTLLTEEERQRRTGAWSDVLAGLAQERSDIYRIQWIERTVPDRADELVERLVNQAAPDAPLGAVDSYRDVAGRASSQARTHEIMVVISVRAARRARARARAGPYAGAAAGGRALARRWALAEGRMPARSLAEGGESLACSVLVKEAALLEQSLRGAGVPVIGALGPRALSGAISRAVSSDPGAVSAHRSASAPRPAGLGAGKGFAASSVPGQGAGRQGAPAPFAAWPWPMAIDASWSCLRTDGAWHATYWIAEWPRIPVTSDFLRPLLLQSRLRSSVAVTMEPISPSVAVREVEQAKTAELADSELRRRGGFLVSARRRREQQVLSRREAELTDGHAQYRFSGYITVTAGSAEALEDACHEMEQTAARSFLEIRRMFGEQEVAFTYTLPLARGLS